MVENPFLKNKCEGPQPGCKPATYKTCENYSFGVNWKAYPKASIPKQVVRTRAYPGNLRSRYKKNADRVHRCKEYVNELNEKKKNVSAGIKYRFIQLIDHKEVDLKTRTRFKCAIKGNIYPANKRQGAACGVATWKAEEVVGGYQNARNESCGIEEDIAKFSGKYEKLQDSAIGLAKLPTCLSCSTLVDQGQASKDVAHCLLQNIKFFWAKSAKDVPSRFQGYSFDKDLSPSKDLKPMAEVAEYLLLKAEKSQSAEDQLTAKQSSLLKGFVLSVKRL